MTRTPVTLLAALATALAVASCGTTTEETDAAAPASTSEEMTEEMDDEMTEEDDMAGEMMSGYVDYETYAADPAAYAADGHPVVLFFHADWCPDCRATEESLTTEGVPEGLTVVKVDYDSMTDLRQQYGVVQQHTFVQVDADGEEITTWTGARSGEEILAQTQDS